MYCTVMRKEDKTSIVTPIPSGISHQAVIACLHDHDLLVNLPSTVRGSKLIKGDPQGNAEYSVTDKKPVGSGDTTYELQITNQSEGSDTEISAHPPLGLMKIWSTWRVVQEGGSWVLREDVRIEANRAMIGMVKGNIDKSHKEQHAKIIETAKTKGT